LISTALIGENLNARRPWTCSLITRIALIDESPKLTQMLSARTTAWTTIIMPEWYGGERCRLQIATGTAIWYHSGLPPLPIR
jgi:hypothetical protein